MAKRTNFKTYLVMAVILLGLAPAIAAGEVIYVDADASVSGNGQTWGTAYKYLQDALYKPPSGGDEIWVAEGTYYPDEDEGGNVTLNDRTETFQLISGVALYGGFAGTETSREQRDWQANETILSGDLNGDDVDVNDPCDLLDEPTRGENSYNIVTSSYTDAHTVLDGFTITAGNADDWMEPHSFGGGIFCEYSSPTITNCTFSSNYASMSGGGMFNSPGSTPTVSNCSFNANSASYAGAMSNWESSPTVSNCRFIGNSAVDTNRGRGGAIANLGYAAPILANCTFSGNTAQYGGAVFCGENSYPTIVNCILWGDSAANGPEIAMTSLDWGSWLFISYSDVQGGQAAIYDVSSLEWGIGNIDADPCFVEPGYWDPNGTPSDVNDDFWIDGDYHLKSEGWRWTEELIHDSHWYYDFMTSRCIDAGNPGSPLRDEPMTVPDDPNNIWGENIRINMGAYGGTAEASMPPYDWALLADLTNDGTVNSNDLGAFVAYWLYSGECIPSDLNRNQFVDFVDFALFGQDWLEQTSWFQP